jgi:hypothetical protein
MIVFSESSKPNSVTISIETAGRLLRRVFPTRTIKDVVPLTGGLINTNLKVCFESNHDPVVLRLYRDGADRCRKELAIHHYIQTRLRVPEIFLAEPEGFEGLPACSVLEFISGTTFQELKKTGHRRSIQEAAYAVGATLAEIGRFRFPKPGRFVIDKTSAEITVGSSFIDGPDQIARLLDTFLSSANCQRRAGNKLGRLHDFGWNWSKRIPDLDSQPSLVHNDFGNRNIIVREENRKWTVAAVLDWELAFSGSPLLDVGHFLRYERGSEPLREPHFSRGFLEHGGELPDNWREIVRVIDLTGLVECLTHDDLPADVESELLDLIEITLETCP